jgi:hypothetical protein
VPAMPDATSRQQNQKEEKEMSEHLPFILVFSGLVLLTIHWVIYGDHDL